MPGGVRSVVVAWLRVLLPLAALAVLSTLFLLSRHSDPARTLPYARVEADAAARDPRIVAPTWAGVTEDGARVTLAAESAEPDPEGGISAATALRLDWRAADGLSARLTAPTAAMEEAHITLGGGVALSTSSGWSLDAPTVTASTTRSAFTATGGIRATAPFGEVEAAEAVLEPAPDGAGHLLDFTGGVRLVYRP